MFGRRNTVKWYFLFCIMYTYCILCTTRIFYTSSPYICYLINDWKINFLIHSAKISIEHSSNFVLMIFQFTILLAQISELRRILITPPLALYNMFNISRKFFVIYFFHENCNKENLFIVQRLLHQIPHPSAILNITADTIFHSPHKLHAAEYNKHRCTRVQPFTRNEFTLSPPLFSQMTVQIVWTSTAEAWPRQDGRCLCWSSARRDTTWGSSSRYHSCQSLWFI